MSGGHFDYLLETLKLLEEFDMYVHVIDHNDISVLNKFPLAFIENSEVYIMKGDEIVYLGSRKGVYNFVRSYKP